MHLPSFFMARLPDAGRNKNRIKKTCYHNKLLTGTERAGIVGGWERFNDAFRTNCRVG